MPESPVSLLLNLAVTFAGVFGAQYLSSVFHERRENKARRDRAERLREQMSSDLQLALAAVKRV